MLETMGSAELTEWMAYDRLKQRPAQDEPLSQESLAEKLRRVFGRYRQA